MGNHAFGLLRHPFACRFEDCFACDYLLFKQICLTMVQIVSFLFGR